MVWVSWKAGTTAATGALRRDVDSPHARAELCLALASALPCTHPRAKLNMEMSGMNLTLSDEEAETLRRVLASYVSDLRMEIRDTERLQMRQSLKLDARQIEAMLSRLAAPVLALEG